MTISIPDTAVEIQEGLWGDLHTFTFLGQVRSYYDLYSAEGYCFYMLSVPENFDDEGNLKPPSERLYARFAGTVYSTIEEVNANVVSVPIEEGFEIVSTSNPTETA